MIYQERLGEEALRKCFSDFMTTGVSTVQLTAVGHYALAIKHGDEITIFTDPQGALNLYYLGTASFWFVSNSLDLCARGLPDRKIEATKLLVAALQTSLPGEDTFYSNIKRLFGTQLIRINLRSKAFSVERIPKPASNLSWDLPTIQEAVIQYKQEVRAVFRELSVLRPIGLFGTGGMDSRTILAGLLDQQMSLTLMYGIGNSRLTDYDTRDLDIVQTFAKLYDIPFKQLDWSGNQPYTGKRLQEMFQRYGFPGEIYGASESFLRTFDGGISPYPNLFLGGYSPAFTNTKPWELIQASFTFEDLIADAMHFQGGTVEGSKCIADKGEYRSVFAREVKSGLRCAGIDYPDTGASLEMFVTAKLFLNIRAESRFLNLANEFGHYIAPFLMKRLYDPLVSIPSKYRAKDEFQLRLIHALEPTLVDAPLYTSIGPARIDRDAFHSIRDPVDRRNSLIGRIAEVVLPPVLRNRAREIYHSVKNPAEKLNCQDSAIVATYGKQVMNDPLGQRWFNSISDFTPKDIARIHYYLIGLNTLGYLE
jgi:hypothetical protein